MFNTHICTLDNRGVCEQCRTEQNRYEHWQSIYSAGDNILRRPLPDNLEEFPTPYEMGRMEDGEWN